MTAWTETPARLDELVKSLGRIIEPPLTVDEIKDALAVARWGRDVDGCREYATHLIAMPFDDALAALDPTVLSSGLSWVCEVIVRMSAVEVDGERWFAVGDTDGSNIFFGLGSAS